MGGRPWLCLAEPGVIFTGVVATERRAEDCTLECTVAGTGQTVFTDLELALGQRLTLHRCSGWPTMGGLRRTKENCAGIGGIGHGCMAGGATICAVMDSAVRHLRGYYNREVLELCTGVLGGSSLRLSAPGAGPDSRMCGGGCSSSSATASSPRLRTQWHLV